MSDPGPPSLETLLYRLDPARVVLAGPPGPTLRWAIAWAGRRAGIPVLRVRAATTRPGDLLVCGRAELLPEAGGAGAAALIDSGQVADARRRGWAPVASAPGQSMLVRPASAAAIEPAPDPDAYLRARRALSRQLQTLAATSRIADEPRDSDPPAIAPAGSQAPLSIVVPVHDAPAQLRRCLAALTRYTTAPAELVLIDDASSDPEVAEMLSQAAQLTGVRVLRNAVNLGFAATVNRGVRATSGDLVLLNSDTEVGPRWLQHLTRAAHSRPRVATVTAISDNAGAFSAPDAGRANAVPLALDGAAAARSIAQRAAPPVPAPTGNGFCMYVSRTAIDELGDFDADGFPRGYGEENDFCMRALRAGWTHLVDGRTFVRHARGASFGAERERLQAPARALLDARYPEYTGLVREFVDGQPMRELRACVRDVFGVAEPRRPRVLFVIHAGGGGTWIANLELMTALTLEWEPFALTCDRRTVRLQALVGDELRQVREWTLDRRISATDFSRHDYRRIVESVLEQLEIELVHVRHLFKHTFDAPRVAASLGIPVAFSFHDFYFVCPTVHLLDDHDRYCAGRCTPGDGDCRIGSAELDGLPHLKHAYVHQWREEVQSMLADVDAFVTTSAHARAVHRRALPSLAQRRFELIEHGRSLRQRGGIAVAPRPGDRIRILVVANLDVHKGADYIRALLAADRDGRLEFHFVGSVPDAYADLGVRHGSCPPSALPDRAQAIAPAFAGCLSVWAETYSHTLTEAWALGIPVLATDLGALAERVRAHGGGLLLPHDDPDRAVAAICAAADDPDAYAALRERATLDGCASVAGMRDAYTALYRELIDGRRAFVAGAGASAPAWQRAGIRRLLAFVDGADEVHPGSAFVRVLQRYRHPSVAGKLALRLRCPEDRPVRADTDLVLVQRTALDPERADLLLEQLDAAGIPLVVDLDDQLLLDGVTDPRRQRTLARVLAAAQVVLVPNERLAAALRGHAARLVVVSNLLDERLFFAGVHERPGAAGDAGRPLEIAYVGSPTHASDLALLKPVMSELERLRPGRFRLNIVGVQPPGADEDWYHRMVVPDRCKPYPQFVHWLRATRPAWDVAVAPLCEDELNSFKSDLKYLEYSALGLPGIYSEMAPYASVAPGRTGLVAGADPSAWVDALMALESDRELRDRLAGNAFEEVASTRLLGHGADELLTLLCEL